MAEEAARPDSAAIAIASLTSLVALLIAILFHVLFRRPQSKKSSVYKRPLTLRINEVPVDKSHEALQRDFKSIVERDPDLREGVTTIAHHFLVQRDQKTFCATTTLNTSIAANELVKKLGQARAGQPYRFDVDFHGITPLYETLDGADIE
jgi:hypothetical protein